MSNELQKIEFSAEQLELIKSQIAKDATKDELQLFLYQCKRTALDPLTRQIYFVKRGGRMTIQTSIDGFRVIAERSGFYAGQDEPVFTYKADGNILKCAITVYKFSPNGQRYPAAVGVAFYDEYYPNPVNLQKTLKHTMIAKVAEALALRKAFPQDLSGLYTSEEMQQADNTIQPNDEVTDDMRDELLGLLSSSTYEGTQRDMLYSRINGITSLEQFNKAKANLLQNQGGIDTVVNPSQRDIKKHLQSLPE